MWLRKSYYDIGTVHIDHLRRMRAEIPLRFATQHGTFVQAFPAQPWHSLWYKGCTLHRDNPAWIEPRPTAPTIIRPYIIQISPLIQPVNSNLHTKKRRKHLKKYAPWTRYTCRSTKKKSLDVSSKLARISTRRIPVKQSWTRNEYCKQRQPAAYVNESYRRVEAPEVAK